MQQVDATGFVGLMQGDATSGLLSFVPLLLIFGIFYFLVIAPARKRQKELQSTIDALKKGDRIITNGGSTVRWFRSTAPR